MRCRLAIAFATVLFFAAALALAQESAPNSSADAAYWTSYWSQPREVLHGPEEQAFYQNMQDILFAHDISNELLNQGALDSNAQWLMAHPDARVAIAGYASTRGEDVVYNLVLSQERADFVKQELINRGVPEDRIVSSAGWGQLYPACGENDEECWSKNRVVRFVYSP